MDQEVWLFVYAGITGILLLGVYDLLRIWRRIRPHGATLVGIEDFFYWIFASVTVFYSLLKENCGVIRWFLVVGMLLGMYLYNTLISPYVVYFVSFFLKKIFFELGKLFRWLFFPIKNIRNKLLKKYKKNHLKRIDKRGTIKHRIVSCGRFGRQQESSSEQKEIERKM